LVLEGKSQNVELLVFPEYLSVELLSLLDESEKLTQNDGEEALKTAGIRFKTQYLNTFKDLSKKHNLILSTGSIFYLNETDEKFYNSSFLVFPNGDVTEQRKTHTTYELVYNKDIISKGEELKVSEINDTLIGTLICYDAGFPENARILMKKGAKVILQPGCVFDIFGANRLKTFASSRATENQLFVINAQITGDLPFPVESPYHFEAVSSIHAPVFPEFGRENGVLAEAAPNEEGVISAKLDFELLEKVRESGIPQYLKDRREDFYKLNL
jgi:predicted amidohydrolase